METTYIGIINYYIIIRTNVISGRARTLVCNVILAVGIVHFKRDPISASPVPSHLHPKRSRISIPWHPYNRRAHFFPFVS